MTTEDVLRDLNAQRLSAWEAGKEILDRAANEKRALTAEEQESWDRANDDVTRYDKTIDSMIRSETIQREREGLNEEFARATSPRHVEDSRSEEARAVADFFSSARGGRDLDVDIVNARNWTELYRSGLRGPALAKELRVIAGDTGSSGGSLTIPTEVASEIYAFMTASVALRRMNTNVFSTDGGNPVNYPKVVSHGIATQVANQDTALSGTEPALGQMSLSAFDSGQLIKVGADLVEDTGSDVLSFVARQLGRAIGEHTAAWYVVGTGSGQPQGIMSAVTGTGAGTLITGGTVSTGGSLIAPTFEKLIDLVHSINDSYRSRPAQWLMKDSTAATLRKIRDGAGGTEGAFIWEPSTVNGLQQREPDQLLGYQVFTDPNVAAAGSNARIIGFGDPSAFYIRDVRGLRLDRSDDFAFDKRQITFRAVLRTDSDLIDDVAWNIIKQSV